MKMNKKPDNTFRFSDVGKRMPYTVPDGFLDDVAANVLERVKCAPAEEAVQVSSQHRLKVGWKILLSAAAAVVVLFVVGVHQLSASHTTEIRDVEQAFDNLSQTDQAYMMEVYQEDVFINE